MKNSLHKIVFLIMITISNIAYSQNLVPNPSFEDTVACPIGQNQVENAVGWINFRGTPDYFNACAPKLSGYSAPENVDGYQCPANGNAYFGILVYGPWGFGSYKREFFGTQLSNPLAIGQKYYVSFKISLSDESLCACNKIGALFSTITLPYDTFSLFPLNNFAHVYTDSIITDTANWVIISKSFVSDSNYSFVLFGNFFDDQNTDTIQFSNSGCNPYYYLEDFCVSTDSLTCEIPDGQNVCDSTVNVSEIILNTEPFVIYPNLIKNNIFIKQDKLQKAEIKIYSMFGQLLFDNNFLEKNITIDLSSYTNGMYLIQIQQNNTFFNKRILLIK